MFDFPNSPTNGQQVTGPGGQVLQWDGTKWMPIPGTAQYVAKAGDTMQGSLILAHDGVQALEAVSVEQLNASVLPAENNVGRNLLHNGTFNISQRTGPWTTQGYTLDRWFLGINTDTVSVSQGVFADADRAAIGDETALFSLRNAFTGNAAAGAFNYVDQRIEKVNRLSNKTVTLSFWAWASAATLKIGVNIIQAFGTGGTPSAAVVVLATGVAVTLANAWQRYTVTIPIPSVSGKTLGTNGDDYHALRFYYSSGATVNQSAGNIGVQAGTISLWGVQLEIGTVATPLAKRDPADELALCQRFYQVITLSGDDYTSGLTSTSIYRGYWLQVTMRAMPTITYGAMQYWNAGTPTAFTPAAPTGSVNSVGLRGTGLTNACGMATGTIIASADL